MYVCISLLQVISSFLPVFNVTVETCDLPQGDRVFYHLVVLPSFVNFKKNIM